MALRRSPDSALANHNSPSCFLLLIASILEQIPPKLKDFGDKDLLKILIWRESFRRSDSTSPGCALRGLRELANGGCDRAVLHRPAAVDDESLAGHEGRFITGEIDNK
jgi:hypothetical protein